MHLWYLSKCPAKTRTGLAQFERQVVDMAVARRRAKLRIRQTALNKVGCELM
jgi:hypothetical protein